MNSICFSAFHYDKRRWKNIGTKIKQTQKDNDGRLFANRNLWNLAFETPVRMVCLDALAQTEEMRIDKQ